MNKMIRKCAVCSVLTVAVATGWGKPAARVVGGPHKTLTPAATASKVLAPAVAAPKEAPKPVTTPVAKSAAVPVAKPATVPEVKPVTMQAAKPAAPVTPAAPKVVASVVPAPTVTQKALKVLDGGAVDDTDNGLKYQDGGKRLVSCDQEGCRTDQRKCVPRMHGTSSRAFPR